MPNSDQAFFAMTRRERAPSLLKKVALYTFEDSCLVGVILCDHDAQSPSLDPRGHALFGHDHQPFRQWMDYLTRDLLESAGTCADGEHAAYGSDF